MSADSERLDRCRETLARSADEARAMLGELSRLGEAGEFHCVHIGISSGSKHPIEPTVFWTLSYGRDGVATLARDVAMISTRRHPCSLRPDDKWFRRPISGQQADEIVYMLAQDLKWLASCSPEDMGETELYEGLGRYAINTLDFNVCDDVWDDDLVCKAMTHQVRQDLPWDYRARHWLDERLDEVFRSACPPDIRKEIAWMSCFSYISFPDVGEGGSCRAQWDGEGSYSLTCDWMTQDGSSERESGHKKRHLTQSDWERLSEAIVQADLPSWGTTNSIWVYSKLTRFQVDFADGWGLRVTGAEQWDSRCLPIAEFLAWHDAGGERLKESLIDLRQRETDLRAIQKAVKTSSLITPLCIHSDLPSEKAWAEVAGMARMRSVADGMLICDIVLDDIPERTKSLFLPGKRLESNLSERWAQAVIRHICDLPTESEDMGVCSVYAHMRNALTDITCIYEVPRQSDAGHVDSQRILEGLRGLRDVTWNDPMDIVRQACDASPDFPARPTSGRIPGFSAALTAGSLRESTHTSIPARSGLTDRDRLGLPRNLSPYYVEVVWENQSISFARSDEPIGGLTELCSVLTDLATR